MSQNKNDIYYFIAEFLEDQQKWKVVSLNSNSLLQTKTARQTRELTLAYNVASDFLHSTGGRFGVESNTFNIRFVNINELPEEQRNEIIEDDYKWVKEAIEEGKHL